MILVTKWFGTFLCEENRVLEKRLFPKDVDAIAERLVRMQKGGVLTEEKELAEGRTRLFVADRRQSQLGKPTLFDSSFVTASAHGFSDRLMHEAMMGLGKLRTSEPIPRDRSLVQAIRYLDDLIEASNLLNERLHEWYGMHFPELADYARDRRYSDLIGKYGERDGIIEELALDLESIGSEFESDDMRAVRDLADTLNKIYDDRERTEEFISTIVRELCPNLCTLIGGPLAARLISLAGGLERLSSLPSSTIQLLGAEKAMFRHLKSGKRPPKHGVIYQYPEVHRAPKWQRGNIARALAGKISIAARIDQYGGGFRGDQLAEELRARIEDIRRRYPDPPKRPSKNSGSKGHKRKSKR